MFRQTLLCRAETRSTAPAPGGRRAPRVLVARGAGRAAGRRRASRLRGADRHVADHRPAGGDRRARARGRALAGRRLGARPPGDRPRRGVRGAAGRRRRQPDLAARLSAPSGAPAGRAARGRAPSPPAGPGRRDRHHPAPPQRAPRERPRPEAHHAARRHPRPRRAGGAAAHPPARDRAVRSPPTWPTASSAACRASRAWPCWRARNGPRAIRSSPSRRCRRPPMPWTRGRAMVDA